jgi:hypothetical protein
MKGYTLRKNGIQMKTRKINTHLPIHSVERIMEIEGRSSNDAEKELLRLTIRSHDDDQICVMNYDYEDGLSIEVKEDTNVDELEEVLDKAIIRLS